MEFDASEREFEEMSQMLRILVRQCLKAFGTVEDQAFISRVSELSLMLLILPFW